MLTLRVPTLPARARTLCPCAHSVRPPQASQPSCPPPHVSLPVTVPYLWGAVLLPALRAKRQHPAVPLQVGHVPAHSGLHAGVERNAANSF